MGAQCLFQRNYIFSRIRAGGGQKCQEVQPFPTFSKLMGPNCFFYRSCCFSGGFGLSLPPLDSRIAYVPFKVAKNETRSKFFKGIGVLGNYKRIVAKIIFYLLRSIWEVPLVTTKTTLRWLYRDHNFTMILSCLRKLRCIRVSGHNR